MVAGALTPLAWRWSHSRLSFAAQGGAFCEGVNCPGGLDGLGFAGTIGPPGASFSKSSGSCGVRVTGQTSYVPIPGLFPAVPIRVNASSLPGSLLGPLTPVSGLPPCNPASHAGEVWRVSDAIQPTFGQMVSGGASKTIPVTCDGAAGAWCRVTCGPQSCRFSPWQPGPCSSVWTYSSQHRWSPKQ